MAWWQGADRVEGARGQEFRHDTTQKDFELRREAHELASWEAHSVDERPQKADSIGGLARYRWLALDIDETRAAVLVLRRRRLWAIFLCDPVEEFLPGIAH